METDRKAVDLVDADVVRPFARAAVVAALLGAFARVSIPIPISPVPLTLQLLGVFLAGLYLGPRWGTASVLLYLAAGAAGAPVFANGAAGVGALQGESAGYLWAFPVAAAAIGAAVHRGPTLRDPAEVSLPVLVGSLGAGTLVVYAGGVAWLDWQFELDLARAIVVGAGYYVGVELIEIAVAVAIVRSGGIDPT